ncbi:hypothetical protein MAPG_06949 [Magnaporthiopsis poae ATCC 64411]|uniref:Heterokaryon incompatibility domain-containing protein n=1 Tax=Magnaporthiopsis poae (strain ATCC 64411 / 73-15) TaxID=644358 RepID=A0A0C4E3F0_MAGP6|nr:hypothetical protein MAPG_06949 [Magnaporthiopsis poae ATCC 64411]
MLCRVCQRIFGTGDEDALLLHSRGGTAVSHHETYQSLQSSADTGCFVCTGLWMALQRAQQKNSNLKQSLSTGSVETRPVSTIFTLLRLSGNYESFGGLITAQLSNVSDSFKCKLTTGPSSFGWATPSAHTKSAETTATFKTWVVKCIENHDECRKPSPGSTTRYPTRLLDCRPSQARRDVVSLVETSRAPISGAYMTLSHCWGDAHCLSLTTSNYARLLSNFPTSDLPQLYQDAVYVTRQLGVRYLWIDSLCIIQEGDRTDWLREIKTMDRVYYNSFCNISALDAADGNDSLFHARRPDTLIPQHLLVRTKERSLPCTLSHAEFHLWEDVDLALLNTRAWVLQERLLSPRILHFGRKQVYWECQQGNICELQPNHSIECGQLSRLGNTMDLEYASAAQKKELFLTDNDRIEDWCRIVEYYTRCRLTHPGDKLAAISALARQAAHPLRGGYIAGMWEKQLATELLWRVKTDATANRQTLYPMPYRAPSWSWAAVDQPVQIQSLPYPPQLIKVEGYHIDRETDDPTGLIKGGWLRLRGLLRRVQLRPPTSTDMEDELISNQPPWVMVLDGFTIPPGTTKHWRMLSPFHELYLDAPYGEDQSDSGRLVHGNASRGLYYVPFFAAIPSFLSLPMVHGLILESTEEDNDTFRRVGLCKLRAPASEVRILGTRMHNGMTLEDLGDGMRSIVIV